MLPTSKTPPRTALTDLTVLVYGPTKIGKTTWCSHAEGALFLATEAGLNNLETFQVAISTWEQLLAACGEIAAGNHPFKAIVLDTVDNAFRMCADYVCAKHKVEHESDLAYGILQRRLEPVLSKSAAGIFRAAIQAWGDFFPKSTRLDEITPARLLDYRAWRTTKRYSRYRDKAKPISPRTVNADQTALIRILNEAVLDGHLVKNPLAGMKKLRSTRRQRRYMTKEELHALLTRCPEHFRPLVVTAAYTGARKGELTRLRWSDLDFEGAKIALYRPKVGNADWIDMHPAVAAELKRLKQARTEELREEDKKLCAEDHVFLSWHRTPFVEVRRSWILALKAAGLAEREGLTFHSLRHSFATHFLQNGGAVTDLQQQLGHAELATTQIYASALSARRRAAVMALDFGGTPVAGASATSSVANS